MSEPYAISINRRKSLFDVRLLPSAMFDEMETAARQSCDVNPNRSDAGKPAVAS